VARSYGRALHGGKVSRSPLNPSRIEFIISGMKSTLTLSVLQVIPSINEGGAEQSCLDVSRALVARGGSAYVFSKGGSMSTDFKDAGAVLIYGNAQSKNPIVMLRNAFVIAGIIRSKKINVVHVRSRAPAWSCFIACTIMRTPLVTTFHSQYNFGNYSKKKYNSVMTKGAIVIANSKSTEQHILQNYGVTPDKVVLIHRGINVEKFSIYNLGRESIINLRREITSNDKERVITLPGRLTSWKGHGLLIEALHLMKERCPSLSFKCVFVGSLEGNERYVQYLTDLIQNRNLSDCFRFLGHFRNMELVYASSDLIVSASTEPEGFGRVSAEAQAMEKVVVASNHGGSREIIIDAVTGWLFEPNDSLDLSRKMEIALTTPEESLKAMGRLGRQNILRHFSREVMCEKTMQVYDRVVG
jgi:glycosyltransferase involved in cell wall biosynthesis